MDDLKLLAKNGDQLERLINTLRIFSDDIKMEFKLSKCDVWIMKRRKGIIMTNGNMMKKVLHIDIWKF